jgi:hypothetical protein
VELGIILKKPLIILLRGAKQDNQKGRMAAINRIKVTSLLPAETIKASTQTPLSILSFWLSFFSGML